MITAADVISYSGLTLEQNDSHLLLIIPAVNDYVEGLPSIDREEDGAWGSTTTLGAIMLAARLYNRKNSPAGVQAVGDTTTYISRYDSDISRLLNIDSFKKPMVG